MTPTKHTCHRSNPSHYNITAACRCDQCLACLVADQPGNGWTDAKLVDLICDSQPGTTRTDARERVARVRSRV